VATSEAAVLQAWRMRVNIAKKIINYEISKCVQVALRMASGEPAYLRTGVKAIRSSSLVILLVNAHHPHASVGFGRTPSAVSGGAGPFARQSCAERVCRGRREAEGWCVSAVDAGPALAPSMAAGPMRRGAHTPPAFPGSSSLVVTCCPLTD
jgi:hypothetical protein